MSNNNDASYGAATWGENPNTPRRERNQDQKKIPFLRFKEGSNIVRLITIPFKYYAVRVHGTNTGKFGKRIKTAYPKVARNEDPALSAGLKEQTRYLVGAIYRGTPDEPEHQVGLIDMSSFGLYQQFNGIKEDVEYGPDLTALDLNVRRNSKAAPANYYTVLPRPKTPLSEADVALKEEVQEALEETLVRFSTPYDPEYVQKQLDEAGWSPETVEASNGASMAEADDSDYEFKKPAAQAN